MVGVYGSGGSRRPWGTSLAECAGRTWTDDEAAQRIPSTPRHATLPGTAGVPDDGGSTRITPVSRHPERLAVHLAVEPAFGRYLERWRFQPEGALLGPARRRLPVPSLDPARRRESCAQATTMRS